MIHSTHQPGSRDQRSTSVLVEMTIGHFEDIEDGHAGIVTIMDLTRSQHTTHTIIVHQDGDLDGIAGADLSIVHGIITPTDTTIASITIHVLLRLSTLMA